MRLKLAVDTACEMAEAQGLQFERAIASQITEAEGIKKQAKPVTKAKLINNNHRYVCTNSDSFIKESFK